MGVQYAVVEPVLKCRMVKAVAVGTEVHRHVGDARSIRMIGVTSAAIVGITQEIVVDTEEDDAGILLVDFVSFVVAVTQGKKMRK